MVKTSAMLNQHSPREADSHQMPQNAQTVNCAILGDGMVGKTCMTISYTQGHFIQHYTATVYDEFPVPLIVEGEPLVLNVFDTAGQSDFESLRLHTYRVSEVLVLCFSVCDRDSFSSILTDWAPEIKRHTKRKVPVVLVGTQTDLRRGRWGVEIGPEEGQRMAKVIGADVYIECSARTGAGVAEVFQNILSSAINRRKRKNSFFKRLLKR